MGEILSAAGFTEVYCTPHCLHGAYDNTPQGVQRATAELQQTFQKNGISLKLHPGMEYYLDEMFLRNLDDLQPLGNSRLVLVEPPGQASPEFLKDVLFQMMRRKWIPVLAHPERCPQFEQAPAKGPESSVDFFRKLWPFRKKPSACIMPSKEPLHDTLRNMGCRFQGNISSFGGWYGPEVTRQAHIHLGNGLYEFFGSDAHHPRSLKKSLEKGLQAIAETQGEAGTAVVSCKL